MELDDRSLSRLLPAFLRLDKERKVSAAGSIVIRLVPECIGAPLRQHFEPTEPWVDLDSLTHEVIEIQSKTSPKIRFKGPVILLEDGAFLALRYAPADLAAVKDAGLHLSDFPPDDSTIDTTLLLYLQQSVHAEMDGYVRQLSEEKKRAELLLEYLTSLSSMVSHDFGNLLSNINLNLSRLKKLSRKERGAAVPLALIEKAVKEGSVLAKSLLDLAKRPSPPVALSPDKFIHSNRRLLAIALSGRAQLKLKLDAEGVSIATDRNQLLRALLNLVLNARDAVQAGGEVEISTFLTEDSRLHISVTDNGSGIPPEVMSNVLQLGFTTRVHGSGIGLASVKEFCEAFNGCVDIFSNGRDGTTVSLNFPTL